MKHVLGYVVLALIIAGLGAWGYRSSLGEAWRLPPNVDIGETILVVVLAVVVVGGSIAYSLWESHRYPTEVQFVQTVLAVIAENSGLQITHIPLAFRHPLAPPPAPVLYGVRGPYQVMIAPDYPRDFLSDDPRYSELPWVIRILGEAPIDYPHFPVAPKAIYASNDEVVESWERQKLRTGVKVCARAVAGQGVVIDSLLDPARRPLRVTRLEKLPHQLQAVVEYVKPPKVKFRSYSFRMPTDPEDLQHIINDLIAIADALPLKDYD